MEEHKHCHRAKCARRIVTFAFQVLTFAAAMATLHEVEKVRSHIKKYHKHQG